MGAIDASDSNIVPPSRFRKETSFINKWSIVILMGFVLFTNHYVRDSIGTIQKQLQTEIPEVTETVYSLMNFFYFLPNIISPILAGLCIKPLGGVNNAYYTSFIISSIGHLLFGFGIQMRNISIALFGKFLSGAMYEIIDAFLPILYLNRIYNSEFHVVMGLIQVFLRFGSVVNFVLTPYLYLQYNIYVSIWVAQIMGCLALPIYYLCCVYENLYVYPDDEYEKIKKQSNPEDPLDLIEENSNKKNLEMVDLNKNKNIYSSEIDEDDSENLLNNSISSSPIESTFLQKVFDFLYDTLPLNKFNLKFWLYFIGGCMIYGTVVPFWFFSSKYFQNTLYITLDNADIVVAFPELAVMIFGFPIGLLITKYRPPIYKKLIYLGTCLFLMSMALACFIYASFRNTSIYGYSEDVLKDYNTSNNITDELVDHNAIYDGRYTDNIAYSVFLLGGTLLGLGFGGSCSLFWGSIGEVVTSELMSSASIICSCGVNVLPTFLPLLFSRYSNESNFQIHYVMILLFSICTVGFISTYLSSYLSYNELYYTKKIQYQKLNNNIETFDKD